MTIHPRYSKLLIGLLILMPFLSFSQVTISGPDCVISGPVYLYNITGQWQAGSTVRVCVTGGILADSGTTCAGGKGILSFVRVVWDSTGVTSGTVAVTSSLGNSSLSVTITQPLSGGQIDAAVASQTLNSLTTPATLTASGPTGGACQPAYIYQWQQSNDNIHWQDVTGASAAQFAFTGPLSQTMFYRRLVTDTAANLQAYSNVAMLTITN